jgi:hypothetical protein
VGWPIIVLFFSAVGIALYFATARAPGMEKLPDQDSKRAAYDQYERRMWRRATGAVIHCVGGDGLGILTGMVIARASGLSFWREFWFEYLIGFAVGWLIFQRKSMTMMTENLPEQLVRAFRGEFFSMLTVMGGMGAVMTFVTPLVVPSQPKPWTFAFWGFGMLGLLVGFIFTYPMNWMLVKLGWKHGMGSMQGAQEHQVQALPGRVGVMAASSLLGIAGLVLPAWLTEVREDRVIRATGTVSEAKGQLTPGRGALHWPECDPRESHRWARTRESDGRVPGDGRRATRRRGRRTLRAGLLLQRTRASPRGPTGTSARQRREGARLPAVRR